MSFWKELKRRNVYKVGVAYAIVAWLLIQAASIIFPHLNLPSWAVTLLIVFLIACFPIALLLAWAYEVTPDGIKRTKQVPLAESITHLTGQKLNYIVTGLLVLAVGFLVVKDFYFDRVAVKQEVVTTETAQVPAVVDVEKTKKTIAVIPFVNRSSDKDQEYFSDGLSDEIITMLSQISDLQVTSSTSSFAFKNTDKTLHEVASVLGVEHILEGSVRKAGNDLRITAQLIRVEDDSHLWSETYNRELKDIFTVQEDIATAVADELKVKLGINSTQRTLGGTDNVEAYQHYLIAQGFRREETVSGFNKALESLDTAIALDPQFALAWTYKGLIHQALAAFAVSHDLFASELDAVLASALKAIEIEPNLSEAYAQLGGYRLIKGDFFAAESSYRKAIELKKIQSPYVVSEQDVTRNWDMPWVLYLQSVGYLEKAHNHLDTVRLNDPFILPIRMSYIMSLAMRGDMKQAEQEFESCRALFGERWADWSIISLHLLASDVVISDEILGVMLSRLSDDFGDAAIKHIDSPEEGLLELRRIYANNEDRTYGFFLEISTLAAYFGDPEFALDALEKAFSIDAQRLFNVWFPVMHEVRQLPRFKEFVREIGLVDYWNKFGWPDLCRPLENGDFECD